MTSEIEQAFYTRPGQHQGQRSVRLASDIEVAMTELMVDHATFLRVSPLIERLRNRTLTRRRYEQLVAVLTAHMLKHGQADETALILACAEDMWRACPASWLPDFRKVLAHIRPRSWPW